MDLRDSVNITYLVELYVDKPLLDKNMTISIAVEPPYIHVHRCALCTSIPIAMGML